MISKYPNFHRAFGTALYFRKKFCKLSIKFHGFWRTHANKVIAYVPNRLPLALKSLYSLGSVGAVKIRRRAIYWNFNIWVPGNILLILKHWIIFFHILILIYRKKLKHLQRISKECIQLELFFVRGIYCKCEIVTILVLSCESVPAVLLLSF